MPLLSSSVRRACVRYLTSPNRPRNRPPRAAVHNGRPFRVAIIGSGPAGFYSASRLMSRMQDAVVDMYEHQPVPFGLVRFGVAPDHAEVKNCQDKFEQVAASPRFNFVGNIGIGRDLPLAYLPRHYDAIVFAYGASKDKELGVVGEGLDGVYSARAFVGWYNGLPEYAKLNPVLDTGKHAVIVGQGNVALDVARILLTSVDALRRTDMTEYALEALARSRVESVRVVGRRGPCQAAFTIKEVRELFNLPNVFFKPIASALLPPPEYKLSRQMKRLSSILQAGSRNGPPPEPSLPAMSKQWSLDFLLSPASFGTATASATRIAHATFQRMCFVAGADRFDRAARVHRDEEAAGSAGVATFPADVLFRSVGYKSEALPGLAAVGVAFDARNGVIPNDALGRAVTATAAAAAAATVGEPVPGMYVAGWVKRGPTGVIASTMDDAFLTADSLVADRARGAAFLHGDGRGWDALRHELPAGARPVSWLDWKRIDAAEKDRGSARGKAREKFVRRADMLQVLDA